MPYYALFYELGDDYLTRRAPLREKHLKLANEAHGRGEIILAGALADPPDKALLIFRGPTADAAIAFAKNDPYVINGLVKRWEVRTWTVVIGSSPPV